MPCRWTIPNYLEDKIIDELKNLQKLKSENDIEFHVQKIRKRGNKIKLNANEYTLSAFDTSKIEILEEVKSAEYQNLEDLAYRTQLTYDESIDISDAK